MIFGLSERIFVFPIFGEDNIFFFVISLSNRAKRSLLSSCTKGGVGQKPDTGMKELAFRPETVIISRVQDLLFCGYSRNSTSLT